MSFDYDKIRAKHEGGGDFWTAYSDLFTVLSVIFLMLYVVAALRSGTFGIQKHMEYQRLSKEAADLKEQIRVYNALRDEQLAQSSEDEQKQYEVLMEKLDLLQDEAKEERKQLIEKAKENQKKEQALNKYQQMIRNIINTNMLAKRQIKQRDTLIAYKDLTINEREVQIKQLNEEVKDKERTIAQNEAKIEKIEENLEDAIARAKADAKRHNLSKKELEKRIARLREESEGKIDALDAQNRKVAQELTTVRSNLQSAQMQLTQTNQQLAQTTQALQQTAQQVEQVQAEKAAALAKAEADKAAAMAKASQELEMQMGQLRAQSNKEKGQLIAQLQGMQDGYAKEMAAVRAAAESKLAAQRAALQEAIEKERLSGAEKAAREAAFRAQAERDAAALKDRLGALDSKMKGTEKELQQLGGKLKGTEQALAQANADKGRLVASVGDLSGQLKRAKELAEAKKRLTDQIKENFRKAGVKADVDEKTGEVVLSFGDDYFETGSSDLKPSMRARLEKFIPEYTKALFNDPKTADKIANVEIVGFASSTYKGRYVNPQSLNPNDREAIDYNLKLSFNRANAIFKHIFDPNKLEYQHQKDLLPLVKVVGRGYLPDGKTAADLPEGMAERDFCKQYGCTKAQRVIIKFNLKD